MHIVLSYEYEGHLRKPGFSMKSAGRRKLLRDISANTLQTGVTQVAGLVFFYLSSRYLNKDEFGDFNWSSALGATLVAILSLGLDLIFVKRIASGRDVIETSGIHLSHTLLSALVICGGIWLLQTLLPYFGGAHPVLFFTVVYLSLSNVANSFKLCLNGLEAYRKLALLAILVNSGKFLMIMILFLAGYFTVYSLIAVYGLGALLEFFVGYAMVRKSVSTAPRPIFRIVEYKYFILESLPQLGVVLFDSALARIDWILLGIIGVSTSGLTAAGMTAEYSFTYKVFEVSKLPLLIIAPVLLTRFSKLLGNEKVLTENQQREINILFRLENFILLFLPLFFISVWSPLMDYFTDNKYGAVNESKYWVLALCIPMHGLINFLWTSAFVQGQLKRIMLITISVSVLNLIANLILIPLYGGMGAALAFLGSTLLQLILYLFYTGTSALQLDFRPALYLVFFACLSLSASVLLPVPLLLRPVLVLGLYTAMALLTKTVNIQESLNTLRGRS